ncbi:MAG: hypothetical protein J6M20_13085 [Clostridia bacterium]|nr:hypothetical protein [Clostridia bacterium]
MPHRANCAAPGVCVTCGLKNDSIPVNDHDVFNSKVYHDETTHWRICTKCGEKAFEGKHYEYCQETNGCCYECGYVGTVEPEHQALKAGWVNDADSHWKVCAVCQKVVDKVAHADGNSDGKCDACGYTLVHTHAWGEPVTVPATCATNGSTTTTCTTCGEKTVETIPATGKHTWGAPVTVEATCVAAGSKTTACTVCGEKTVETIPATGKHSWETVNRVYATCTKAGRTERVCTVCDELSVTTQGAKGHSYGLVFITEGNGTHAKTCADCGAKHVENCVLTSTEMGNMVCSACATCGYTVYTMTDTVLEEVEDLTETKAEIEVKRVENVSFEIVAEPVEEGTEAETETETEAEPTETADVVLVVHETELEMTVELPDTVNASVKKVLAVSMLKEGNAIQPSSKVKLSIPVVEEEVTGMKLVLMNEDGQLIEIAYEIIDGVIVFETDMVGIFLFVEAEA